MRKRIVRTSSPQIYEGLSLLHSKKEIQLPFNKATSNILKNINTMVVSKKIGKMINVKKKWNYQVNVYLKPSKGGGLDVKP